MALETLKDLESIGGFPVAHHYLNGEMFAATMIGEYIIVDHSEDSIKFEIQQGPIKESGVNGCQLDQLIQVALHMIEGLNKKFPCNENSKAIFHLNAALNALEERKRDREKRGVEGCAML